MSILIKGMGMPKNCDECFFVGRGFPDWCSLPQIPKDEDEIDDTNNRPDWCPLEEVPETHEERTETHACDCIERQAVIEALEKVAELFPWRVPGNRDSYDRYNEAWNDAIGRAEIEIEELPSAQPEIIRCKDCKHFEYDHPYVIHGVPVLGHEVCNAWGDGCKTDENGYCFLAERRTDDDRNG